jgi:hypothetical protein
MKKIVMIVGMALATIGYGYSQERTGTDRQQDQRQDDQREQRGQEQDGEMRGMTEIDKNQLPSSIQNTLDNGEFSEWDFEEAYRVDARHREEGKGAYVVKVEKDGQQRKLHFDENGNMIRQESRGNKDKGTKDRGRRKG